MGQMFSKQVLRSIRASLGRYLAILLIVALGCGFYAGLRMTGPDMRLAADAWYDGTELYDIQVVSTLGFTQRQVDELAAIEGVAAVMPQRSVDAMTLLDDSHYVMRVHSFDAQAAVASHAISPSTVESDDARYLNRLVLEEGSWPVRAGEAVLSADRVMNSAIQVGDTVQVEYGARDLDGILRVREYTVVGLAHSSLYTSDTNMGTTSLGSGKVQQYMYVSADSFDADYPFSEVYVKVTGADAEMAGSEAYQACVDAVMERIEAQADFLAQDRLAQLKEEAQQELDEAQEDYERAEREASEELAEAEQRLVDGQAELDAGQAKLDEAQRQIRAGEKQLSAGASQLEQGKQEAAAGEAAWQEQRAQLEEAIEVAEAGKQQAQDALPQVQAAREEAAAAVAQLSAGIEELSAQIAALQAQCEAAEQAGDLQSAAALSQAIAALEGSDPATAADPNLASLQAQQRAAEAGLAEADAAVAELQAALAQAEEGIAQASAGIAQGDAALASAADELAAAEKELASQRKKLEQARSEYAAGLAQLEASRDELSEGWDSYESAKADAERELAEARDELANAQDDIDALEAPELYLLDRTKNMGVRSVQADSERIDNIASVFPFVFFLVAALVALTTMTRMVDEERQLIGTFKALGYSKRRITGKYLVYAGSASAAGALLGILVLGQVLPSIIQNAYAIIYNVPALEGMLPYDPTQALAAALMGVGITLLATWAAAVHTLREVPAALMLPPAPVAGKRILLERIGVVWSRLSFSWKVACRNLFRYKKRFWMTVIGLAGCTALLVTGFGLHNAIWDIIDRQYGPILGYNVVVDLDEDASEQQAQEVEELLRSVGAASVVARVQTENLQVGTGSLQDDTRGVTAVVARSAADLSKLVHMKVRETQASVPFDDNSVVLTEKLARTLGVEVGDELALFEQDSVGNATGSAHELRITGIMENYVADQLYVGKDAFRAAFGGESDWNALLAESDPAQREVLNEALMESDGVQTVAFNDETIDTYRTMLQSVNSIVVVLVLAAALLSFIVLYNLININITERRREIASLKVLGFTSFEVYAYIFREVLLLTLIGTAIGLVLGIFLEGFVVTTAEVDYVMFGREIHAWSFAASFALTIAFTCVVMLCMQAKLAAIDMVESLKSVE